MPPPNITGRLHLGHALDLSLQDTLIRAYASRGAKTTWTPGCDHAGLATHEKILDKLGWSIGPMNEDETALYLSTANAWADEHKRTIFNQFKSIHPFTNLENPRFTLDADYIQSCEKSLRTLGELNRLSIRDGHLFLNLASESAAMIDAIKNGRLEIHPAGHANRLIKMLEEQREWDIGRDIPWGQRFSFSGHPARLDPNGTAFTLDTWFSSGIWPSAIKKDPNKMFDGLIIGYDIAFFWAARMWMLHFALYQKAPFERIHLHGLIRDKQGRKFSKSLGNGIDPMEIIESHGSDTLRIWCLEHAAWGRDFKYDGTQLLKSSGLLTKMLNATRLILSSPMAQEEGSNDCEALLSKDLHALLKNTESELFPLIQDFQLDQAYQAIRRICWSDWCEGWLNNHKQDIQHDPEALKMAKSTQLELLALLHPFAPATTWWLSKALKNA